MKDDAMSRMSRQQTEDLERLKELPEEDVDTSDIPEVDDWSGAVRGRFHRSIKRQITLRLDADLLAWFRAQGRGYQTRINAALREHMESYRKQG